MRNIEVKARLLEPQNITARLRGIGAGFVATLRQRDVFYAAAHGRLKLRVMPQHAELIFYRRSDTPALRSSEYQRLAVADAEAMVHLLDQALGRCGEVRKVRQLYQLDNVRIHVDAVEGLGDFLEIEAVVDAEHDEPQCHQAAAALLAALQITPATYESRAYIELLAEADVSTET